MKKSYLILLVVCLVTTSALAQRRSYHHESQFRLGIIGGLNIPRLTGGGGNPLSEGWTSREGFGLGLASTFTLNEHFDLQIDALYSSEGGRHYGWQAFPASAFNPLLPANTYFYADSHNESILNYLEVPVMAKYNIPINKSSKFFIELGPYAGYLLNAKQKISKSGDLYIDKEHTIKLTIAGFPIAIPDSTKDVSSSINKFNVGVTGGIGYSHQLGLGDIFLDIRGSYGFLNIQRYKSDGTNKSGNILVALGYEIPL